MNAQNSVRIVSLRDGDIWIAQCLEHDVCVQANDLDTLKKRILVAIRIESNFASLPAAPKKFFDLWDRKTEFDSSGSTDGIEYKMAVCG